MLRAFVCFFVAGLAVACSAGTGPQGVEDEGPLTGAEAVEAKRALFDDADADGDGMLDVGELSAIAAGSFDAADVDGDGVLDQADSDEDNWGIEFTHDEASGVAVLDADSSGSVSRSEFDVPYLDGGADEDGDGQVTWTEWSDADELDDEVATSAAEATEATGDAVINTGSYKLCFKNTTPQDYNTRHYRTVIYYTRDGLTRGQALAAKLRIQVRPGETACLRYSRLVEVYRIYNNSLPNPAAAGTCLGVYDAKRRGTWRLTSDGFYTNKCRR